MCYLQTSELSLICEDQALVESALDLQNIKRRLGQLIGFADCCSLRRHLVHALLQKQLVLIGQTSKPLAAPAETSAPYSPLVFASASPRQRLPLCGAAYGGCSRKKEDRGQNKSVAWSGRRPILARHCRNTAQTPVQPNQGAWRYSADDGKVI